MNKYIQRDLSDPKVLEELSVYPELLAELLISRGISDKETASDFLNPDYEKHVHDPFLMKGMDKAVERILRAIKKKEKIVIYSDYDADGIPGAVLLNDFFKKIDYKNFSVYIPHRHDEGFGLNKDAVEDFGKDKVKLLITIDCGITDFEEVEHARKFGIDVIITDHHLPGDKKPKAFAIIDPKQDGCEYPDKNLCGSGVAFKLVCALIKKGDFSIKEGWEKWLLDMVGIATLSDMVSLTGENRVFAHFGLKVLRKSPRPGLMKILRRANVKQRTLSEDDIVFSLTPKINAASRMGVPMDAFNLLSTTDEVEADEFSSHLLRINDERKGVVGSLVREINKIVNTRYEGKEKSVIVAGNPLWKPSLLGLVANSLIKDHSCPVFLWGRDGEEVIKGSCRSDGSVSVVELMREASLVFSDYGGHFMSGGFTVSNEKIHLLPESLEQAYKKVSIAEKKVDENNVIDKKLSLSDVNFDTYRLLEKLGPFGIGNPKPKFLFEDTKIKDVIWFGKEKNHLKIILEQEGKNVPAIAFFAKDVFHTDLEKGKNLSIVGTIEYSNFGRTSEIRLRIVDII